MGLRSKRRAPRALAVLLAVTLFSCLPLVLVEVGLRAASVGTPSVLFLPSAADPDYLLTNTQFAGVYFVPGLARTLKVQYIRRQKRPETYRIVVLGGSAAVGYPENRTGFSRKLEVLLRRTFPDLEIEVVNLATAAVNSYVAWDVAQHSIAYDPDLFLVYTGNNEVIGPFGPLQKTAIPIEDVDAIRALVSVKRLRLAQLVARWTSGAPPSRWQGMQAFIRDPIRASDPRLQRVYANFRRNLEDIRTLAHASGAAILFGSVLTKLADFAPFASAHREGLGDADLGRWRRHYEMGSAHLARGDFDAAARAFEAALRVDDEHAETHYRLGRAYRASGDRERAEAAFVRARDLDALRFRADSTINAIIEAVASDAATGRVGFVDVVGAVPNEPAGDHLLLDHVHFSSAGNDWLARTFYGPVAEIISEARGVRPRPVSMTREALSEAIFDLPPMRLPGLENVKRLVSKPPFTARFENEVLVAQLERRIDGLRSARFRLTDELKRSLEAEPDNFVNHWLAQDALLSELRKAAAAGDAVTFERGFAWLREILATRGDNADLNARREKALRAISEYAASHAPGA